MSKKYNVPTPDRFVKTIDPSINREAIASIDRHMYLTPEIEEADPMLCSVALPETKRSWLFLDDEDEFDMLQGPNRAELAEIESEAA